MLFGKTLASRIRGSSIIIFLEFYIIQNLTHHHKVSVILLVTCSQQILVFINLVDCDSKLCKTFC